MVDDRRYSQSSVCPSVRQGRGRKRCVLRGGVSIALVTIEGPVRACVRCLSISTSNAHSQKKKGNVVAGPGGSEGSK